MSIKKFLSPPTIRILFKFYSYLYRHTTRKIIEALPELGMVIDLTNTPNRTKYYQPYDWKSNGIDYRWIKTEGEIEQRHEQKSIT